MYTKIISVKVTESQTESKIPQIRFDMSFKHLGLANEHNTQTKRAKYLLYSNGKYLKLFATYFLFGTTLS